MMKYGEAMRGWYPRRLDNLRSDGGKPRKRSRCWVPVFFSALAFLMTPLWAQSPQISRVDPNFGTPGDPETIIVYVQNVASANDISQVIFNTTRQPSFFVAGFNGLLGWQVNTSVPVGATTGPVSVQTASGQIAISSTDFPRVWTGPAPGGILSPKRPRE